MIGFEAQKIKLRSPSAVAEYTGSSVPVHNLTLPGYYNDYPSSIRIGHQGYNSAANPHIVKTTEMPRLSGDIYSFKRNDDKKTNEDKNKLVDQIILIILFITIAGKTF